MDPLEDEFAAALDPLASPVATRAQAATKRTRAAGRPPKPTLAASKARRISSGAKTNGKGRNGAVKAGKEIPATQNTDGNETEEVDEFDMMSDSQIAAPAPAQSAAKKPSASSPIQKSSNSVSAATGAKKRGRARKGVDGEADDKQAPIAKRGRPAKKCEESTEILQAQISPLEEEVQKPVTASSKLSRSARPGKGTSSRPAKIDTPTTTVPETQPDPMQIDEIVEGAAEDLSSTEVSAVPELLPKLSATSKRPAGIHRGRPSNGTRNHNASLASDPKTNDASSNSSSDAATLRRRLGETTKQLDALQLKYTSLADIAIKEGESNFDKLKAQTDQRAKAAEQLIASLKADVQREATRAQEADTLRTQLESLQVQLAAQKAESKAATERLTALQAENRALQAKLTARAALVPGSAQKGQGAAHNGGAARGTQQLANGAGHALTDAQKARLKEDLYADLTGLLVMDVRRQPEIAEHLFDCIQTGRNGTLHFHLCVADDTADDAQFTYAPLLDEQRDRQLLRVLPDYLTESIQFDRANASRFYGRVMDCLSRRVVEPNEDEE